MIVFFCNLHFHFYVLMILHPFCHLGGIFWHSKGMFKPLENVAYYKENKQNLGKRRLPFANIKGKKTDKPGQNVHRLLWSIIFGVKAHCAFEVSYTAPPSFTNWWFDFAYNFLIGDNGLNCSSISTQIITDLCVWIRTNWWYLAPNNICSTELHV